MTKNAYIVILVFAVLLVGIWYVNQGSKPVINNNQANNTNNMDGLKIEDLVVGTGEEAKAGDTVSVNYVGTLDNGTKFDSSYDRKQPIVFQLGVGQVIPGWDKGIEGMKVGGKRRLTIAPEMGYGANAVGPIPANSTLHFDTELVAVEHPKAQ